MPKRNTGESWRGRSLSASARGRRPSIDLIKGYLFLGGAEAVIGVSDKFVPLNGERGVYVPAGRTAH